MVEDTERKDHPIMVFYHGVLIKPINVKCIFQKDLHSHFQMPINLAPLCTAQSNVCSWPGIQYLVM